MAHVIKLEYDNGIKLPVPTYWCGADSTQFDVCFKDAQHVALSIDQGSVWGTPVCKECLKEIVKALTQPNGEDR